MLRSHIRPLAVVSLLLLGLGLLGTSCQQTADDCNETLSCPSSGGSETTGGTGGGLGASDPGGNGGLGGAEGGQGGMDTGTGGLQPCDPMEETCGGGVIIHVSPNGYDEDSGSKITPVKTVAEALTRIASAAADDEENLLIYLCTTEGAFEETLSIGPDHNGVGIYGGFDCDTFEPIDEHAVILADEPGGHRIEDAATVTLGDVRLESPDAVGAGASSIALTVVSSTGVRILRSELVAGEGAAGEAGMGYAVRAQQGQAGNGGHDACTAASGQGNPGGLAAVSECEGSASSSVGGLGGPGGGVTYPDVGGPGNPGQPGGGAAGTAGCMNGGSGGDGAPGDHGLPSGSLGGLTTGGYTPPMGDPGTVGTVGKGGGGGGGAAKPDSCATGASGGSGGGGGCPGAGAGGGQGGGGSFGLVSVSSQVELEESSIVVALGGEGGKGGDAQPGGLAGSGGNAGGPGGSIDGTAACDGGNGGQGGRGGSGGGGAGGPSIGVAYVGDAPAGLTDVTVDLPSSGATGGPGGILNSAGAAPDGTVTPSRAF